MRSGSLRILFAAVLLAVAALAAVGFFADRVERALQAEQAAAMAADLVVEDGELPPEQWLEQAARLGLETSRLVMFPSVVMLGEEPLLVQIKAVEPNYPPRGQLVVRRLDGSVSTRPPRPGEAVLEPRLLQQLPDTEPMVPLGTRSLRPVGELVEEPDPGVALFQLAPRLLVSWADAHDSGLLGPASRARYRLLLAGERAAVERYRRWLEPRLSATARLLTDGGRPELNTAIDRARRFLGLAALCASLLAGVAILLAARDYLARSLDEAAILRTLGMTSWQLLWRFLRRLLLVGLLAGFLGGVAGLLLQQGLTHWLGGELGRSLPPPDWRPMPLALAHAALLLLGFALPSLWAIRRVPPLRVLRRELNPPGVSQALLIGMALGAYWLLVFWQVNDVELAISMTVAVIAALLLFAGAGGLLLLLLGRRRRRAKLPIGALGLVRQPGLVLMQLAGFGLGLSLLLLLGLVRSDLLAAWQYGLAEDAPNHFLINIQPDEASALRSELAKNGITDSGLYPTTRARLKRINDRAVTEESAEGMRARRLATREYSLGFGDRMQSDNRVIAGRWWQPDEHGFSVEEDVAEALGIELGDRLQFEVAGQPVEAPVLSLREVQWDSFHVNFFVQGSASLLRDSRIPHSLITSVYLPPQKQAEVLEGLRTQFPAVSAIAIGPLLEKVRGIVERGSRAVEAVFLFTLGAALLVSLAALQLTRAQREREIALLRTLGASREQVLKALLVEFGSIGLLAGLLSALLANLLGSWLGQSLFGISLGFDIGLWLTGPLVGALLLGGLGWLAGRPLLALPPLRLLR